MRESVTYLENYLKNVVVFVFFACYDLLNFINQ